MANLNKVFLIGNLTRDPGRYFLVYFTAEPQSITAIERLYKINESVLRAVIFIHEVPA